MEVFLSQKKRNSRQYADQYGPIKLPSDSEIIVILKNARKDALEKAKQFGMVLQSESIAKCELRKQELFENISSEEDDATDVDDYIIASDGLNQTFASNTDINPFVYVENEDGSIKEIRKSTMVWLLTEYKEKLSAERLQRVQTAPYGVAKRPKLDISSQPGSSSSLASTIVAELNICERLDEIQIGQWCVFRAVEICDSKSKTGRSLNSNKLKNYIIGAVAGFKCLNEKYTGISNDKNKKPSKKHNKKFFGMDSAHTSKINYGKVEVLASWYSFDSDGVLHPISSKTCFYVPISFYLATITAPKYGRNENLGVNHLVLSVNVLDLQNELKKLLN